MIRANTRGIEMMSRPTLTVNACNSSSYRSREPLRVIGEVAEWQGHSPEELKAMKDGLERLKQQGVGPIDQGDFMLQFMG
jgi:hypothetical protein